MLKDILPEELLRAVDNLNYNELCEIRLRLGNPVTVNYKNTYYYLGKAGLATESGAFVCTKNMMQAVIAKASNFSVYAINDEIKEGYISVRDGIRIGVVGTVVAENKNIITQKNLSSLNIRIPHQVANCAHNIAKFMFDENGQLLNTLIAGAPGTGKTTILRDLCVQLNKSKKSLNILLLDERVEISGSFDGYPQLNVGSSTDIICGGMKSSNILNGIRSMSPDVIVADEIGNLDDIKAIEYAINCGVSIVASVHCKDILELRRKKEFENLLNSNAFKRIVIISSSKGKGTVENIYDSTLRPLLRFV